MDCISRLNQIIYSDSEISKKATCAGTKTETSVNTVLVPYLIAIAIQNLN
jgi:hypothetical protein